MAEIKSKTYVKVFVTKTNCFRVEVTEIDEHVALAKRGELFHRRYQVSVGGESWNMGKGAEHIRRIKNRIEKILFSLLQDYLVHVYKIKVRDSLNTRVTFDFGKQQIEIGGKHV